MNNALFKNKNYKNLYFAGLSSEAGSFITETAIMLYIFELSNSDRSLQGITRAVFLIFFTIGGFVGGPIGSLYNRKSTLIACELLRIPVIISMIFYHNITFLIIASGLIALFTGIFNPSRQTLVNEIVAKENISDANSLFGSTMAILHLIGPLVGAWFYGYFNGINEVLTLDFATYILGVFLLCRIKYTPKEDDSDSTQSNFISELKEGYKYVLKRLDLLSILISAIVAGLAIGILIPLLIPYCTEVLKIDTKAYGTLLASFGLGGILGGLLAKYLSKFKQNGKIIVISFCLAPVLMMIWLHITNFYLSVLTFFIWGIVVFTRIPVQLNYVSDTVEVKYMSRIHSLLDLSFIIPTIAGGLLIGFIGDEYSTYDILYATAIGYFLLIYPRLFFKETQALYKSTSS